ncbi:MAG: hypothetical protein Q4F88_03390 [Eubacteriales bacterium]|nr:hypothetical protein [Eubacteriales bacterium]
MDKKVKETLKEMIIAVILFYLALQIISIPIVIFSEISFFSIFIGLLAGLISSILILINIAFTATKSLDSQDKKYAKWYTIGISILRRILYCVVVIAIYYYFGLAAIISLILCTFSVKFSAFLQPKIHNIIQKYKNKNSL